MKLPLNCEVDYLSEFLDVKDANDLFAELHDLIKKIEFYPKTADGRAYKVNFGKVMFLDQELLDKKVFPEEQWGLTKTWTPKLEALKAKIEDFIHDKFQVCVLIYYPDGNAGVDFHSDYVAFGDTSLIPSISLGEEREFKFREIDSGMTFSKTLKHGSLVVMGENCQERYEHSLPINPAYRNARINLTFRKYGFN